MSEKRDNTLSAYKGPEFQQRLIWQLLVEPEFAEKIIPDLAIEYFDDPYLKRLYIIMLEYYKLYEKVPNLQNHSIHQAINEFKTPNNIIEEESLFAIITRIELWNERIINKQMLYDGDIVQQSTNEFIKQQEYRKLGESIHQSVKNGDIRNKYTINAIEERFQKISHIGEEEDDCEYVTEGIRKALRKEFRQTIPTGVGTIDSLTGGGLGKGEIGVILTPSGVGKALPLSAKLLTPNGWISNGDVQVGDLVIGSDGKPQRVLGVYPQGVRDIYKVKFNDNTTAMCDKEHLWSVNSLNQRTANTTRRVNGVIERIKTPDLSYKELTLESIMMDYIKIRGNRKILNYRIPIIKPVEFNDVILPINPYLLGILIGDGGLSDNGIIISSIDDEIINEVNNIIDNDYDDLSVKQISNTISYRITGKKGKKNQLFKIIKNLNLNVRSENKHLPKIYLHSSINNRVSLLQGLMDSDGYASKSGRVQYSTTSETLKNDVRELVLSLGGFCNVREKIGKYKKNGETISCRKSYTLTISFSDENIKPFKLERKQCRVIYRNKYKLNKYISNIEYSHKEEAQCIYVENDDHLYVTDDFILTHNTTLLTVIANTAYEIEKNVAQIIFEDTKDQVKRKHYTIWAKSALSKLDDDGENERVVAICEAKAKSMEGKGRLVIKRFSQEDTTMKDVTNWMLGYQKKWGFKFDLLVLDYLDCLESHKKTPDRNESELAIIKAFEATAADFNIPAWTAIQSNRTGFGSEFVEAHQSGGSIKRIQKAHFFMSVAKTPAQHEANFANIRIIKARFAKDGQSFEDCIFNNDTMQIIIDDPRYPNSNTYKNLKHHDESDVESVNKKVESFSNNKIHLALSEHSEKEIISRLNSSTINDMLSDNKIPESTPNSSGIIIEEVEEVIDDIKPIEDVKVDEEAEKSIKADDDVENISNLLDKIQEIDTNKPKGDNESIQERLLRMREHQRVIKKE